MSETRIVLSNWTPSRPFSASEVAVHSPGLVAWPTMNGELDRDRSSTDPVPHWTDAELTEFARHVPSDLRLVERSPMHAGYMLGGTQRDAHAMLRAEFEIRDKGPCMTVEQWSIVIGVIVSGLLALAPWMLMVHAKLAVLTATIESLEKKVDKLIDDNEQRQPMCAVHTTRLDVVESQLAEIHHRLRQFDHQWKEPGQT